MESYVFQVVTVVLLLLLLLSNRRIRMGLANLQSAVSALQTTNAQLVADIKKLLAGATTGPGPGQVIVNQADIDALTTTVNSMVSEDQAADATVNPPAPPAPAAPSA